MSFCLNPACPKPNNPDTNKFCHGCGSKLAETTNSYNFEHYRIIKLLGEGGFGRTYLAEDLELFNKKVVIKKLLSSEGNNPKIIELFTREAEQLFKLSHSQIPQVYRYFSKDNNFYLIQEFIPGENLLTEVESQGNFNENQIREILLQILPVLEYIQSQDILHRDIKPENIMRRRSDNQLMLIDFGAVRVKSTTDPSVLTSIYTPGYASREQMNARPVKASDIYSLGVTCIRLLTGCFPTGTTDLIYDDYDNKWTWKEYLQQKHITIDNKLAEIIDKMIEDSLKRRYQDAKEVIKDLLPVTVEKKSTPQTTKKIATQRIITVKEYFDSGLNHYSLGEYTQAISDYSQALKLNPNDVNVYYNRGVTHGKLGEYTRAISDFNQVIKLNPNDANAYNNLGVIYNKLGKYQEAINHYNQAIKLNPNYTNAYYNRGLTHYNLGKYQEAIADYNQALKLNPNYTNAIKNRNIAYSKLKELTKEPLTSTGYMERGLEYYKIGEYNQAISDYNQASKLNYRDAKIYYNRGNAYSQLTEYSQAITDFNLAIKLNPNYTEAYYSRGLVYNKLGQKKQAISDYSQAIKIHRDYAEAYYHRGVVYVELGQYQNAINDFTRQIRINPNDAKAYNNRGFCYAKLGQFETAIKDYIQAKTLNPDYVDAIDNLNNLLSKLKTNKLY